MSKKQPQEQTEQTKEVRARNWTCVAYPESLPENWFELLQDLHIPCAISPLHDADLNGDGSEKKAHYHVLFAFEGNKSFSQIKEFCDLLHATIPQVCRSVKGLLRYFLHLDNPEKHQYDQCEIKVLGGFNLDGYLDLSYSEKLQILKDITVYCWEHHVTNYTKLCLFCIEQRPEWYGIVSTNTFYLAGILKGIRDCSGDEL